MVIYYLTTPCLLIVTVSVVNTGDVIYYLTTPCLLIVTVSMVNTGDGYLLSDISMSIDCYCVYG